MPSVLEIPEGFEKIEYTGLFPSFEKVVLPASFKHIKAEQFKGWGISEINITDNIISIEYGAFCNNKLESLVIPKGQSVITYKAYMNNKLKSLSLSNIGFIEDEAFANNQLQDLYQESLNTEKELIQTIDQKENDYTYQWSAGSNPINLVLGYIVNCCAKINGAGEDIMRQAMTNPFVQNLLIRDTNNNIVAKATAYYNKEDNYILFNNVEGISLNKGKARACLNRAINDQIAALASQNIFISEVRVGMLRNDIFCDKDITVEKKELLKNYRYSNYEGDANNFTFGQGILYNGTINEKEVTYVKRKR